MPIVIVTDGQDWQHLLPGSNVNIYVNNEVYVYCVAKIRAYVTS